MTVVGACCLSLVFLGGCRQDMADQPRIDPLEGSDFFADGQGSRPLVPGTVARGHLRIDRAFFEGRVDGESVIEFPRAELATRLRLTGDDRQVMSDILHRGRERFDIYCAPCHDRTGGGRGMVVQRGFPAPPSLHIQRLRDEPVGHFYDVVTRGFGRMPSHADQIPPVDRWAIVAYVRALQLSQHAEADRLPPSDREALRKGGESP